MTRWNLPSHLQPYTACPLCRMRSCECKQPNTLASVTVWPAVPESEWRLVAWMDLVDDELSGPEYFD